MSKRSFFLLLLPLLVHAQIQPKFSIVPLTSTHVQVPAKRDVSVEYRVTNNTQYARMLTLMPMTGITQNTSAGKCGNPFMLSSHGSCLLALNVNGNKLPKSGNSVSPKVCKTVSVADNSPSPFMCSQPNADHLLKILRLDSSFPYGSTPKGNVCVTSDYYATPETMLGSWAMIHSG